MRNGFDGRDELHPPLAGPPPRPETGRLAFTPRSVDVHRTAPWTQFAYVSKRIRELVRDQLSDSKLPSGARVVDYGCADVPYRDLFAPDVDYIGADLSGNPRATVELRGDGSLPLPDSSADLVLSTQVLEHVADPALYLAECRRVLAPGGSLLLTTHGIMYLHRDPHDYWRWTCDGLAKIVEDSGLEVVEMRGVMGLAAAALQLFQDETRGKVPRFLLHPFVFVFQTAIAFIDRFYSEERRKENALVLGVRAIKTAD